MTERHHTESWRNWRALADALTYAMTETGVDPEHQYVQGVAQDAAAWLERYGYRIDRPTSLMDGVDRLRDQNDGLYEACQIVGRERDRLRARIEQHRNVKDTHHRVPCEVCDEADERLWAAVDGRPSDTVPAPPARQPDRALRGYIEQANRRTDDG